MYSNFQYKSKYMLYFTRNYELYKIIKLLYLIKYKIDKINEIQVNKNIVNMQEQFMSYSINCKYSR